MQFFKEPIYKIVNTNTDLLNLRNSLDNAISNNIPISIDVETTGACKSSGLDPYHGWLLGISFCMNKNIGYYIPLNHTKNGELVKNQLSINTVVKALNPLLSVGGIYLAHNGKFDLKFLWKAGLHLYPNIWDTMIAVKLINGNTKESAALKKVIYKYIQISPSLIQTFEEASGEDAAESDVTSFCVYAINDVIFVYYLYEALKPIIDKEYKKLFYEAEMPLLPILAHSELRGIKIDVNYFKKIEKPLKKCKNKIEKTYLNKYDLNIASPLQVGEYIKLNFKDIKLQRNKKTGNIITDVEALQTLKRQNDKNTLIYKFVKHILIYREINKAINTYINKYPKICLQHTDDNDTNYILHTNFNQLINSGRLSSTPNVQNITRDSDILSIRKGFVARKGKFFVEGDWKGVELRLVAIASKDSNMFDAFTKDPYNADLHTLTAKAIFQKDKVTTEERHIGKTINFSIVYGATEYSISTTLNCSKDKAKEYLELFNVAYPGISKWKQEIEQHIIRYKHTSTLFGRKRYLPVDVHPQMYEYYRYKAAVRELINHIIQGTSADLLKFSMVNIIKEFAKQDLDACLISTTHDSIISETNEPEKVKEIMNNIMSVSIQDVLLPVDFKIKKNFSK